MSVAAIILAAGRGTRAGGGTPKQWRMLGKRSVLAHAVSAFTGFGRVIVVLDPADMARGIAAFGGIATLISGGRERAASVRNALESLDGSGVTRVLIHDGARPLVPQEVIARVLAALEDGPAAAPALPVTDALWRGEASRVTAALSREGIYRAQTPQGFHFAPILAAHRAHAGGAADDVAVARAAGIAVAIVEGAEDNLKLTWPEDFARAARILDRRHAAGEGEGGMDGSETVQAMDNAGNEGAPHEGALHEDGETLPRAGRNAGPDIRLGNGYDVHAFRAGDHVTLCGIRIPHERGLEGHSDADVGMHALTDAIYGALAAGDIGRHFPPSDPQWKGAASEIFLAHAAGLARTRGYRISNADVTLVCERPKIGPHAAAMAATLARILDIAPDRVSVKATTSERLGFTGREEGIAAIATATLIGV